MNEHSNSENFIKLYLLSGKTIIVNLTIEKMMQLFNDNDQAKAVIYKSGF